MEDFKGLKLNEDILNRVKFINPMEGVMSEVMKRQDESIKEVHEGIVKKEQEKLRRHNEMIDALKEAAQNGATILVGDNANGVQILQNSEGASQEMTNSQEFNYKKTIDVLKEIKEYFDFPKFKEAFGTEAEVIQEIVNQTIEAANKKEDPRLITKSLQVIKNIAAEVGSSLIAKGIIGLLGSII